MEMDARSRARIAILHFKCLASEFQNQCLALEHERQSPDRPMRLTALIHCRCVCVSVVPFASPVHCNYVCVSIVHLVSIVRLQPRNTAREGIGMSQDKVKNVLCSRRQPVGKDQSPNSDRATNGGEVFIEQN